MNFANSIFKFIDIEDQYNLNNLKNNEVLCKFFNSFNDPYEGHFGIETKWPSAYKDFKKLKDLITRLDPENAAVNAASVSSMKAYIKLNAHMTELAHSITYKTTETYRVCSFTRRWNHILMWSHYSKGGSGAVLIFDKDLIVDGDDFHEIDSTIDLTASKPVLDWVKYKHDVPIINSVDMFEAYVTKSDALIEKMNMELFNKCILTKSSIWRYEQETRLVFKLHDSIGQNPVMYKYPNSAIKGVIVGNRCSDEGYIGLAESLDDDVNIYLAEQQKSRYKYSISGIYAARDIKSGKVSIKKELR
ncbi:MAG: DUF2971 domain-containing protein [Gammaproteobacteria bacterium]|nr:DUF2971 domain-containing protein [Gammaproteobacteria bacterium]